MKATQLLTKFRAQFFGGLLLGGTMLGFPQFYLNAYNAALGGFNKEVDKFFWFGKNFDSAQTDKTYTIKLDNSTFEAFHMFKDESDTNIQFNTALSPRNSNTGVALDQELVPRAVNNLAGYNGCLSVDVKIQFVNGYGDTLFNEYAPYYFNEKVTGYQKVPCSALKN
jgi:hypothetical protein